MISVLRLGVHRRRQGVHRLKVERENSISPYLAKPHTQNQHIHPGNCIPQANSYIEPPQNPPTRPTIALTMQLASELRQPELNHFNPLCLRIHQMLNLLNKPASATTHPPSAAADRYLSFSHATTNSSAQACKLKITRKRKSKVREQAGTRK